MLAFGVPCSPCFKNVSSYLRSRVVTLFFWGPEQMGAPILKLDAKLNFTTRFKGCRVVPLRLVMLHPNFFCVCACACVLLDPFVFECVGVLVFPFKHRSYTSASPFEPDIGNLILLFLRTFHRRWSVTLEIYKYWLPGIAALLLSR